MKKNLSVCLLFFTLIYCLNAFDNTEIYHDTASSSDGEWTIASVIGIQGENKNVESIWLHKNNGFWSFPVNLLTFTDHSGWSYPSVCYNRQNESFMVYQDCWKKENSDGGIYEFYKIDGQYSPSAFNFYAMSHENAFIFSNEAGVYLAKIFGRWKDFGDERNYKIYKVDLSDSVAPLKIPHALENIEISRLNWLPDKNNDEVKNHSYRDVFFTTSTGLIFLDADESTWWHFDCIAEKLAKFESKEAAFDYDEKTIIQHSQKTESNLILVKICIGLFAILICLIFALIHKKRKTVTVDDLNTRAKNRFVFGIQETERSKISRDIHDSVIQDIRVIRLETENLDVEESSKEQQNRIKNLATECIIKLRNICYNLAPAELAHHSDCDSSQIELVSIINTLAQQFSSRTHVPCSVTVEDAFNYPVLEKEKTQNLFRVVQEALTNIEKHSYATQVSIFFKTEKSDDKENTVTYITDDGIGISNERLTEKMKDKSHLGLRSMKDRMDLIGGSIEFVSDQDCGMEIIVRI